jgi:hypothetical protein
MTLRNRVGRVAAPLALVGLISACGGVAVATPRPTAAPRTGTAAVSSSSLTIVAQHQYASEVHGPAALSALHRVGRDQTLLRTLQSGNLSATRAYVQRQFPAVWYHWHVARMRILQGSRVVVETGVPFAVAPAQMTLHGAGGRNLGTLQVSIQDEIGFVRLIHRHHPVDVVVRGRGAGHVRSSLPAAAQMKLPSTGSVTIAGLRYRVSSFHETAWGNEPITVSILQRA